MGVWKVSGFTEIFVSNFKKAASSIALNSAKHQDLGLGPSAQKSFRVDHHQLPFPCLWLCLHEALPALLRGQKNGNGKGPQGTGRIGKKRDADFEQVLLQVAPGRLVRAVGEECPQTSR